MSTSWAEEFRKNKLLIVFILFAAVYLFWGSVINYQQLLSPYCISNVSTDTPNILTTVPSKLIPDPLYSVVRSIFKCDKNEDARNISLNTDLTKLNISETTAEFCFNNFFTEKSKNLKVLSVEGIPFVSNKFEKKGYSNAFRSIADWHFTTEINNINVTKIKCGDIIFVTQHYINYFFETYHSFIKVQYILISHESDYPAGYPWHLMYLNQGKIARWFGQNVVATHLKLEHIPIGVIGPYRDYMPLYDAAINIKPYFDRMTLLYLNFSPRTNGNRSSILQYFKATFNNNSRVTIDERKTNWTEYLSKMKNSQFVLSPPGNGMDCFRTWEALTVGAVPIVLNNSLLPLYEDMTVMVVNSWAEVTEENMLKFQRENLKNFSKDGIPWRPKVWLRYWINRIINYKTTFKKNNC